MVMVTNLSIGRDRQDIWFNRDELDLFKSNRNSHMNTIVLQISSGRKPDAGDVLGMEKFLTPGLFDEFRNRRRWLKREVLNEARSLRQCDLASGVPCNDGMDQLAGISAVKSEWARDRARAAALWLEQDQEAERLQCFQRCLTMRRRICNGGNERCCKRPRH